MRVAAAMLVVAVYASCSCAQVIDFETIPGGTPQELLPISDQFNVAPYWVTFEMVSGSTHYPPILAEVGPDQAAFRGPEIYNSCSGESSDADKPALGQNVGCFFLGDDGVFNWDQDTLRISYTQPVRQASGEILDVDGTEIWTVTALAADLLTVLGVIQIEDGDPGTGDGVATYWALDLDEDIHFIEISGEKPGGDAIGIAFDNFSPASVAVDLSVSKTGPVGPVELGDTLSYTIVVENLGPGTATSVALTDRLPQGVEFVSASPSGLCSCQENLVECDLGTLEVDDSVTVEIVGLLAEVSITNDVGVIASEYDLSPDDNSDSWYTSINCGLTGVTVGTLPSEAGRLGQNRPNPFNPTTKIEYSIRVPSYVRLLIFDSSGRVVKHLVDAAVDPGVHQVSWGGLNDDGYRVASGVYFYQLESNGEAVQRKMVVIE